MRTYRITSTSFIWHKEVNVVIKNRIYYGKLCKCQYIAYIANILVKSSSCAVPHDASKHRFHLKQKGYSSGSFLDIADLERTYVLRVRLNKASCRSSWENVHKWTHYIFISDTNRKVILDFRCSLRRQMKRFFFLGKTPCSPVKFNELCLCLLHAGFLLGLHTLQP
jgi:hypothetical protein